MSGRWWKADHTVPAPNPPVALIKNQIRHLRGNGFGARFADIEPLQFAFFRHLCSTGVKALVIRDAVIRRGRPLAITGASIASSEPVRVTLVETIRCGWLSSV